MKTKKFIAGISAFVMFLSPGINYISAEESAPVIYGDVDGDGVPQINDLTKMSLYLLQDITFNENQKKAADVNADGKFNIADLATMKQYIMHDDIKLGKPVSDLSGSNETFDFKDCKAINEQTTMYHDFMYNYDNHQTARTITSLKDFNEYNDLFDSKLTDVFTDFIISDDFFKDNTLIVVAKTEGSGSITNSITNVSIDKETGISVEISTHSPEVGTCVMAEWHMGVIVPNKYLEGIDTTSKINITNIDITNTTPGEDPDSQKDVKFDISECNITKYRTRGVIENLQDKTPIIVKSLDDFNNYPCDIDEIASKLKLSDEFFKDNTVIIVPITFVSGSIKCEISNIKINTDKQLSLEITSVIPDIRTDDITNWHLAASIPNKYLENVDISKIDTNFVDKHLAVPDTSEHRDNLNSYDYSCVSIMSHADFSTQSRMLTVINSTNYERLDDMKLEFGKEFDEICSALNISDNIQEDDFYKENSLCILPCPKRSDFMGEQISDITVDENGVLNLQLICFDSDNIKSDATGNLLAFTIPNKYLTNNNINEFDVRYYNPKTYYYKCKVITNTCGNCDSKMQNKSSSAIIRSVDELNKYKEQFDDTTIENLHMDFTNLNISDQFFKENTLVLVYIPEPSGSVKNKIYNITTNKNNNISIEILSVLPRIVQCDLIQYQFAIAIPNNLIENVDLSSLDINYIQHSLY